MTAKKMLGKLKYKEVLAGKNYLLGIELDESVEYLPGQFVSMKVSEEGLRRSYSVASLPNHNKFELVIDTSPMGVGSKYILSLKDGDTVEILGFLGKFVIKKEIVERCSELVFVGTGAGIAPLKPMIEDLLVNQHYKGKIYLFWGMRFEKDLYWLNEFEKLQRSYDNFHFELVLSKPNENWLGKRGHVGEEIEKLLFNRKDTNAYLCGSPEMISEVKNIILKKGVPDDQIIFERYA